MEKEARDQRRFLRETQIDVEHNLIRFLLGKLYELVKKNADYRSVVTAYFALEEIVLNHFETEESEIKKLHQNDEVAAHFKGHKSSHDVIRLAFECITDKFKVNNESREVPNIVELLPQKYFDELEGWDGEMMALIHNNEKNEAA